ncbi:MAG: hypothetical protein ACPGR8_10830 [Limisphaerales bacterium]
MWSGFLIAAAAVASERANYVPRERPLYGNETVLSINGFESEHVGLIKEGNFYMFGDNTYGQLGLGQETNSDHEPAPAQLDANSPTKVPVPDGYKALDACVGWTYTCVILQKGQETPGVSCWGLCGNRNHCIRDPAKDNTHGLNSNEIELTSDFKDPAFYRPWETTIPGSYPEAISCGYGVTTVLLNTGNVWMFGYFKDATGTAFQPQGNLLQSGNGGVKVKAIDVANTRLCYIVDAQDSDVYCCRDQARHVNYGSVKEAFGQTTANGEIEQRCVSTQSLTHPAVNYEYRPITDTQYVDNALYHPPVQIASGEGSTCIRVDLNARFTQESGPWDDREKSNLWCFGYNGYGQLNLKSDVGSHGRFTYHRLMATDISAGHSHYCAMFKADFKQNNPRPLGSGQSASFLIERKVACWGTNNDRQLGDLHIDYVGNAASRSSLFDYAQFITLYPPPAGGSRFLKCEQESVDVSCGRRFTCFTMKNCTVDTNYADQCNWMFRCIGYAAHTLGLGTIHYTRNNLCTDNSQVSNARDYFENRHSGLAMDLVKETAVAVNLGSTRPPAVGEYAKGEVTSVTPAPDKKIIIKGWWCNDENGDSSPTITVKRDEGMEIPLSGDPTWETSDVAEQLVDNYGETKFTQGKCGSNKKIFDKIKFSVVSADAVTLGGPIDVMADGVQFGTGVIPADPTPAPTPYPTRVDEGQLLGHVTEWGLDAYKDFTAKGWVCDTRETVTSQPIIKVRHITYENGGTETFWPADSPEYWRYATTTSNNTITDLCAGSTVKYHDFEFKGLFEDLSASRYSASREQPGKFKLFIDSSGFDRFLDPVFIPNLMGDVKWGRDDSSGDITVDGWVCDQEAEGAPIPTLKYHTPSDQAFVEIAWSPQVTPTQISDFCSDPDVSLRPYYFKILIPGSRSLSGEVYMYVQSGTSSRFLYPTYDATTPSPVLSPTTQAPPNPSPTPFPTPFPTTPAPPNSSPTPVPTTPASQEDDDTGLSTGAIVGISVGVVAVGGGVVALAQFGVIGGSLTAPLL